MKSKYRASIFIWVTFVSFSLGLYFFTDKVSKSLLANFPDPSDNVYSFNFKKRPPLKLNNKAAISIKTNFNFERKIFAYNEKTPLPIASLTKLMVALIVFESEEYDLEQEIIISYNAASQENVPTYGNLMPGQKLKVKNLLELMLVYSSNDAAFALTEKLGLEKFIERMNEKAKMLELKNTHFANPTGLEPKDTEFNYENLTKFNYSTVEDLANLVKYILQNFPQIFEISRKVPKYRLENGIFSLFLTNEVVGGKTGYTPLAGGCLVFVFKDNKNPDFFYINIILGTPTIESRIFEMQKLIDWLSI